MAKVRLPHFAESYGVLIGTGTYASLKLDDLPGVLRNLDGMRDILLDTGLSGFLDSHVTRVQDPAQADQIMAAVSSAGEQAADILLIYYAGHGLLIGENSDLYLSLTTSRSDAPWNALPFNYLAAEIKRSKAINKILILDCCYSGRARKYLMADEAQLVKDQLSVEGLYMMTSASNTKRSSAPPEAMYTAFTGKFIEAARKGVISTTPLLSMSALFEEVRRQMRRTPWPVPEQYNTNTVADLALIRNVGYAPAASPNLEPTSVVIPVGQWVWDLTFSPDGRYLATGSRKWLCLWASYTGEQVWKQPHGRWHNLINGIAFSADGKYVAGAVSDRIVKVWDVDSGAPQSVISGMQELSEIAFSPDGHVLAAGFVKDAALIWDFAGDAKSREEFTHPPKEFTHPDVNSVALSLDGRLFASGGNDRTARVWDINSGQELIKVSRAYLRVFKKVSPAYPVSKVALSPDGKWLAIVGPEVLARGPWVVRTVHISSEQDGPEFRTALGLPIVEFSPTGKRIAIIESEVDGSITRVWDNASGRQVLEVRHTQKACAAAFSSDGERLAIGGAYFVQIFVVPLLVPSCESLADS